MTYAKILVPTDFSPPARVALDHARTLADRFGGQITVLHVWQTPPIVPEMMLLAAGGPPMAVRDFVREQASKEMETLVSDLRKKGVVLHGRLEQGDAATVVAEVAARDAYDLIVMATHGRTGVERMLIGSVAEKLLRRTPCPVLVVRPSAAQ